MKSDYKIKEKGNYVSITMASKKICDRLRELGFNNRKTYGFDFDTLKDSIPIELKHHFIRGMFDGDGSICIYHYPYFKKHSYHLGYTGVKYVVDYIYSYFNLHTKLVDEGNKIYTCVSANSHEVIHWYNLLYKEAHIYMDRKHKKFCEAIRIINEENLLL